MTRPPDRQVPGAAGRTNTAPSAPARPAPRRQRQSVRHRRLARPLLTATRAPAIAGSRVGETGRRQRPPQASPVQRQVLDDRGNGLAGHGSYVDAVG